MKTETLPYRKMGSEGKNYGETGWRKHLNVILSRENINLAPAAFLLGRAVFAGGLMPFGTALYASVYGTRISRLLISALVLIGMFTAGGREQLYISAISMILFNVLNIPFKNSRPDASIRCALLSFLSVIIPELIIVSLQGFLLYDFAKSVLNAFAVFSLVFVFRKVIPILCEPRKRIILGSEEKISIAITAALVLLGLDGVEPFGLSLKNVLSVLIILMFSFRCGPGVGSASGVTIGLILSLSTPAPPVVVGSYALCGLLAGALKKLGKLGSCVGFVMGNAILTIYLNGSSEAIIYLKEIVIAVGIFILCPQKLINAIAGFFNSSVVIKEDKKSYSERIKEITVDRLNKFSRAFMELSKSFSEVSRASVISDKQDISSMFDRVADRVCKDCSLCMHCWDRNFYSTYQVMFKIIERLDTKGRIEESDIPQYFLDRCERINYFVDTVNNIYEIFKVDIVWKSKIGESRGLVSQQMEGLSKIISNLAWEIDADIHFKSNLEDLVAAELNKLGIRVTDIVVFENKAKKYEVNVLYREPDIKKSYVGTIEKIASEIIGRKMVKQESGQRSKRGNKSSVLKLVEEEQYRVTTGIAKASKYDGIVSGDSYTFMDCGEGKYIIALSDGMGSGGRAAAQSRATISLLEQFLDSGFDKDTAIRLINSILVLKSNDDSFATIDLSVIDLYDGEVEFIKIGAVSTYIKRDAGVEVVKSVSLPAGILNNIELELMSRKVGSGDIIVMVTDGIVDSFEDAGSGQPVDRVLSKYIEGIKSINPQEIADSILEKAFENCSHKPADDMMVLAAKVWRRAKV